MPADVIVLAGGRSSRLGGVAKASLLHDGRTLLQLAIASARSAGGRIVVVGPEPDDGPDGRAVVPSAVRFTRERPAFGGPAAAIAAGLVSLRERPPGDEPPAALVAVLACDMPFAAPALAAVLAAAEQAVDATTEYDGWVALDESGRAQQLLAVYRVASLERRIAALRAEAQGTSGDTALGDTALDGRAVRSLLTGLSLQEVPVPVGGASDVDSWDDAARLGISHPPRSKEHPHE